MLNIHDQMSYSSICIPTLSLQWATHEQVIPSHPVCTPPGDSVAPASTPHPTEAAGKRRKTIGTDSGTKNEWSLGERELNHKNHLPNENMIERS